ncbi:MAG: EamA family transporter [Candidatus Diapherotrites archaeon]|uniref:EamA family transporter n=1 Tax=Candidatus Iainarchaeum sp. TaxID=3101447 RepID=A0A8T3YN85_9ARCH|nr:EamA family transporter [Candidatus Diapherotrites archaeon]
MSYAILAAFAVMLLWGAADYLIQKLCRIIGNLETLLLIDLTAAVLLLPLVLHDIASLTTASIPLMLTLGAIGWLSGIVSFEALRAGKLSVIDAVLVMELPFTIILGIMFFGDAIGTAQWALIAAVIAGTALVSLETLDARRIFGKVEKGAALALLAALIFAAMNFLTAAASRQASPAIAIWFPWTVSALLSGALLWRQKRLQAMPAKVASSMKLSAATALTAVLGWLLYAAAVSGGELSIITAITEGYVAVAVLLGVSANREKLARHQALAAAAVIAATIGLAMTA